MKCEVVSVGSLGLALVLSLSACGGDSSADDGSTAATPTSAAPTTEEAVTLDPADCEDDAFREAHLEFCLNEVPVAAETMGGPATEPATFGNGLTARIVSVTTEPSAGSDYWVDPGDDALVSITTEIVNDGPQPFRFSVGDAFVYEYLYYGVNFYEAQSWRVFDDQGGREGLPVQLVPGTSATTVSRFSLPSSELGDLTFVFNPNGEILTEWTFYDVEELLQ
ncbi:hypothetical protein [Geodermatophilus chilensis]|uniref:hypothetical protein n=1 Tax=Geodermatophilus chilensis TaxID=2035835 RepID=UPI000C263786|nr:hypothetical protein [Geodermatophilus chilensis]